VQGQSAAGDEQQGSDDEQQGGDEDEDGAQQDGSDGSGSGSGGESDSDSEHGSDSGCSEQGEQQQQQQGSEPVSAAATGHNIGQQPQPQRLQNPKDPLQREHLSLLLLFNAEGFGRVAALCPQKRDEQQRELQKQGRQQTTTRLVHLDPHGARPWPCCSATRNDIVPCSEDVCGEAGSSKACSWCACWLAVGCSACLQHCSAAAATPHFCCGACQAGTHHSSSICTASTRWLLT
jgi:hypothetical protein